MKEIGIKKCPYFGRKLQQGARFLLRSFKMPYHILYSVSKNSILFYFAKLQANLEK